MTTSTQTNPMIEEYVARCSAFLWDLSPQLQDQLREDIRQIVGEVAMELDGRPEDLVGPPLRFVTELRVAAGLPPIVGHAAPAPEQQRLSVVHILLRWLRVTGIPWLIALAKDLRPAWWVGRGLGLAFLIGSINPLLGLISAVPLIVSSVEFGRSHPKRIMRATWLIASILALVAIILTAASSSDGPAYDMGYESFGITANAQHVGNVHIEPVGAASPSADPSPFSATVVFESLSTSEPIMQVEATPPAVHDAIDMLAESGHRAADFQLVQGDKLMSDQSWDGLRHSVDEFLQWTP